MPSIAQLSDIHFGGENRGAVEGAQAWLRTHPPDLVALAGDFTVQGRASEFQAARAFLADLRAPVLATPGNHDAPYTAARFAAPFRRYEASVGPSAGERILTQDLAVAAVNTARGAQLRLNWSKGAISQTQAEVVVQALADAKPGALKVVLAHHPLVEMIGGPMTGRVRGGERAARRFAEASVDLILTGHVHAPFALPLPYADGRTYAVGAGTLSVRERGCPPTFNLVEAGDDEICVRALAWTGSHFEPWRSWALPRRTRAAAA